MKPTRIQRQRTKGWKMPENTVYVGRPGRWGNPFTYSEGPPHLRKFRQSFAVEDFKDAVIDRIGCPDHYPSIEEIRRELRGKNLACWCKPGEPCHADVLLEIANG